ncbi:hypothetical protein KP509_18G060600 [Ceratopteris richardii]|uniref:Uncharacterized protein n=1 Tax=Ceratopteris richardii TaxID=49495 RepID=A0A8T2SQ43_CERRI|nr:hypothetical protein KP509_18G060600 [Ceratopteris richardii]
MGLRASLSRTSFKAHQRGWSSGRAPVFRWSHLSQNADITTQIRSFYPSISSVCSLFFVSVKLRAGEHTNRISPPLSLSLSLSFLHH